MLIALLAPAAHQVVRFNLLTSLITLAVSAVARFETAAETAAQISHARRLVVALTAWRTV